MAYDGTITETNTDKLVLQRGRDRVARYWGQGGNKFRPFGAHCILSARTGERKIDYGCDEAHHWAGLLGFKSPTEAYEWNDKYERTQAEVLARFDSAIARLSIPGERDE